MQNRRQQSGDKTLRQSRNGNAFKTVRGRDMGTDSDSERLARAYNQYKNKNYSETFRLFSGLWDEGVYAAGVYLGSLYRQGLGVSQDVSRARELFEEAASHGVSLAALSCVELSRLEGRYEDAFRWYDKLAIA